jgi:endonuclease-3
VEKTERDLKRVCPEATWSKVHLQIIYFGRERCPALWHDLDACPICSWAASKGRKEAEKRRDRALRKRGTKKDGPF